MRKYEAELAWAAGLWDGEGCTHLHKPKHKYEANGEIVVKRYPHRTMSMSQYRDPFVLKRFIAAVGMGKLYGPYVAKATGNQYWVFQTAAKDSMIVLGKLWPYLSEPKKKQALTVFPELSELSSDN